MKKNVFLFFAASLVACANHKKITPSELEKQNVSSDYFIISQGGGFTGAYETYLVQKEGKVIAIQNQSDSTYLRTLAPETVDSMFQVLPNLGITTTALSPPGNMNYALITFIDGTKNTLTWADAAKPNEAILTFYKYALLEVKRPKK